MFPYAAKVYRDYLSDQLDDDVRVAGDVPVSMPARLVTVTTAPAGSTPKPRVFSWRRLVFQCWSADEISAAMLCEQVRDLVVESVYAHIGARKVNVIGEPARWDDPEVAVSRFQTTIDVLFRANR